MRHLTTLLGHGSAFQRLPRRRRGQGGRGGLSWSSVWLFGGIAVAWCIGGGCGCQNSKIKEKACKQMFTGHARQLKGGAGLAQSLVWLLGHVVDVEGGVVTVSSPEYTRMKKKNPVNASLQG